MTTQLRWSAGALAAALTVAASSAHAVNPRPTPAQRLDTALGAVTEALTALHVTEPERASLQPLWVRAEAVAAEQVEAARRGETARERTAQRTIELLARVVRGQIEAMRAEAEADAAEQRASESSDRARVGQALVERAVERHMLATRAPAASTATTTATPPSTAPSTPAGSP
ncbi:MAG: hypothetical protein Q8Q09_22630 [Deltaproteobacteria bacterium]|nr:hypothetical protein [Deltaproteobacteria bacterium]